MAKYLVVKVREKEDTDYYNMKFVMEDTITDAVVCDLDSGAVSELENRYARPAVRCLEIIGPEQVREELRARVDEAKKQAAAAAKAKARQAEAAKKRAATMKQRALDKARALLEAEGQK